jgi:DNA (cytosine-5)-methyltransferase 1
MRAVKEKKPKYFIWENVKGALSSRSGWDFTAVINEMAETGYSLWWQVLNAKDFGVPQNRERIFVCGFRDRPAPEVFFERETDGGSIEVSKRGKHQQDIVYKTTGIMSSLSAGTHASMPHLTKIEQLNNPTHSNNRLYSDEGISPALNTAQGGNRQPKIPNDNRIRRLTPLEAERLMGLPDGWTSKGILNDELVSISDSQRYKLCGNGVVVNVVEAIIKNIILCQTAHLLQ